MAAMNVWPTDALDGSVSNEPKWRKMARHWAPTGIADGVGSNMTPTLAFPNLTVAAGACWVDGHYCELGAQVVLPVTSNGLAVVRFDPAANTAELVWRDGATTPTQSPTGIWELPIAKVTNNALADVRVNSLVASQRIPSFPTAAARAAAIPAPALNQLSMRDDAPTIIEVWNGSGWINQEVPPPVIPTIPPQPKLLLFARSPNQNIGGGATGLFDVAFTMPRTGSVLFEGNSAVGIIGDPPNTVNADIAAAGTYPAMTWQMSASGLLATHYSSVNLHFRAYWANVAQGQVVTARLSLYNVGGPGTANWSTVAGVFTCGADVSTF